MTTWQEPTGRERAIEALMDRDADGDFFRYRKVMEEAVPAALNSRPNRITKAALVEQAFSLHANVIETSFKHLLVFDEKEEHKKLANKLTVSQKLMEIKSKIWKHQASIRSAKTSGNDKVVPPASFYTTIEKVLQSKKEADKGELLKDFEAYASKHALLEHAADEGSPSEENAVAMVESLVANLTKLIDAEEEEELFSGIWITILSVLSLDHARTPSEETESLDVSQGSSVSAAVKEPPRESYLQVGALLPFCELQQGEDINKDEKLDGSSVRPSGTLDPDLLNYFAEAARVYEERLEMIEARKSSTDDTTIPTHSTPKASDGTEQKELTTIENSAAPSVASVENDEAGMGLNPPAVSNIETDSGSGSEISENAQQEGSQEHSGNEGDQTSDTRDERVDMSGSQPGDPSSDASSSSSSGGSSSSSSDEDDEEEEPDDGSNGDSPEHIPEAAAFVESDRDISTDDDDDAILREALGISVGRDDTEAEAVRVILADSVVPMEDDSSALQPAETPVSEDNSTSLPNMVPDEDGNPVDEHDITKEEEAPLPQLPSPVAYPWELGSASVGNSDPDAISQETLLAAMDPSDLTSFGGIPSSYVLSHLLSYAEAMMYQESSGGKGSEPLFSTIPGGMGHDLFTMKREARNDSLGLIPEESKSRVFQLIIAAIVSLFERRSDAIEQLKIAVSRELSAGGGSEVAVAAAAVGSGDSSSGEEGDDPALAFALNYVEDDAPLSIESLENKGMRRKAAAAAHDAESLRKSLKERTEAWKEKVNLHSQCLLSTIRCLKILLQSTTRRWLTNPNSSKQQSAIANGVASFRRIISLETLATVTNVFDELLSLQGSDSDVELLAKELYGESVAAWVECVPFLYPTSRDKMGLLRSLVEAGNCSLEDAASKSERDATLLKLKLFSKRARVKDVLDNLIPPPLPCGQDMPVGREGVMSVLNDDDATDDDAYDSSAVSSLIVELCDSRVTSVEPELQRCFYALCHRMNTCAIMFDGLYAVTETETERAPSISTHGGKERQGKGLVLDKTPSSSLVFDASKCSDSIAILTGFDSPGGNGSTVLQRASKVWGTVLSNQFYSPKTGVHRWAVRLDKCERGHVFVGVATSRANTRTYVGGDKYGWGMIGTQALWHDRRKIRGDYGESFRTGSTVIVTLDTNLGTISLGLWKDTPTGTQDPLVQNLLSPKRQGQAGGMIEDWGIAFEGLPLDAKLYPAVGLYQRDDRVTLLSVDSNRSGKEGSIETLGGKSFYPPRDDTIPDGMWKKVEHYKQRNNHISWEGAEYAAKMMERLSPNDDGRHENVDSVIPAVIASLCLLPASVPLLSQRSALALLPQVQKCLKTVSSSEPSALAPLSKRNLVEGEWTIRATSGDGGLEEYVVSFSDHSGDDFVGFKGTGLGTTGKSKNGIVTIHGTVNGQSVSFLEEWSDESNKGTATRDDSSSCVVYGSISLDGTRLTGRYRNMEFGTTGKVAGIRKGEIVSEEFRSSSAETLLCLAHGHLSSIVADDAAKDGLLLLPGNDLETESISNSDTENLLSLLKMPFLASSSLRSWSGDCAETYLRGLVELYSSPAPTSSGLSSSSLLEHAIERTNAPRTNLSTRHDDCSRLVSEVDEALMDAIGQRGSLSSINPTLYHDARRGIICALIFHCNVVDSLLVSKEKMLADDFILSVWRCSLVIMEDSIREAISERTKPMREKFSERCDVICGVTSFLLGLDIQVNRKSDESYIRDIRLLYENVSDERSIAFLGNKMKLASFASCLQQVALESTKDVFLTSPSLGLVGTESIALGLCKILAQLARHSASPLSTPHQLALANLPGAFGADLVVRKQLDNDVREIFLIFLKKCGDALRQRASTGGHLNSDSLILASLGVFLLCLDGCGVRATTTLLSRLKDILSAHRFAQEQPQELARSDSVLLVRTLAQRDTSYAILRCSTSVVHVCFYRLSNTELASVDGQEVLRYPINWFREELLKRFTYLEGVFGSLVSGQVETSSKAEWARWLHSGDEKPAERHGRAAAKDRKNIAPTLAEVGTIQHLDFNSGTRSSTTGRHDYGRYNGSPGHRHLSHWLHILCAILRCKSAVFKDILLADSSLMSVLLRALGLDHDRSPSSGSIENIEIRPRNEGILPARYRARIAFLLGNVLPAMEPNISVVESLFSLAGSDMLSSGIDDEEHIVSNEAVSLLRKLYDPKNEGWRTTVSRVVSSLMKGKSLVKRIGLHCFLAGTISGVTRLSFVLLKPAAASPLSQDGHSQSGGKAYGSSSSMVPVGADTVLSGLLRSNAEGGIVSNIDEKNGVCEIILTNRSDEGSDSHNSADATSTKPGLTVRALRTPMSEVILAQEISLHIDRNSVDSSSFCSMLNTSLDSLLSAVAPGSVGLKAKNLLRETDLTDRTVVPPKPDHAVPVSLPPLDYPPAPPALAKTDASDDVESGPSTDVLDVPAQTTKAKAESSSDSVSSGVYGLSLDVMTVRSAIVLLSNPDVASDFVLERRSKAALFKILCLAWPEEEELSKNKEVLGARQTPLSQLPLHETKLRHFIVMLRSIVFRQQISQVTPNSIWDDRVVEYSKLMKDRLEKEPQMPSPKPNETASSSGTHPDTQSSRSASHSAETGQQEEDEEERDEASTLAAQHLREAAIAQMGELGIPRSYAELALRRIGGTNIEAAVHFCLENGSEIERLLAEEMQRQARSGRSRPRQDEHLLNQLMEMGFPRRWCTEALSATGNNVDEALTWILNNNDTLENLDASEEDEEEEENEDGSTNEDDDEEEEDESEDDDNLEGEGSQPSNELEEQPEETTAEQEQIWSVSATPLRVVSGRATIDGSTLDVSGQSSGGFASVGVKGVLLKSGKWYYEVILGTAGCIQLGFGDASFAGHCNADRGDGCGDSSSSFSFDGWRRLRWHATATEWGCRWKEGDVVGCLVDVDNRIMSFTLNGKGESIGMGVAFRGFNFCGGLYPVVSFNRREKLRLILGGSGPTFRFAPPEGYRGVGEAVVESVRERDSIVQKEGLIGNSSDLVLGQKCLADLSDEEHGNELFSWSHRYYGSDASVHLGSARPKSLNSKGGENGQFGSPIDQTTSRIVTAWKEQQSAAGHPMESGKQLSEFVRKGYETVHSEVAYEIFNEAICTVVILCRKLLLHAMIANDIVSVENFSRTGEEGYPDLVRLWNILEASCSTRNWSGEAGAMAMAAEHLGLGIQLQGRQGLERLGHGSEDAITIHRPGISQLLTSLTKSRGSTMETSYLFAAAAEWGANPSMFLRHWIDLATVKSEQFRRIAIASIRRSVRVLAGIEESDNRMNTGNDDEVEAPTVREETSAPSHPDARFVSLLSGMLLSTSNLSIEDTTKLQTELFQAWSIGLLSASLPFRMVSAFTAASILRRNPSIFQYALTPTLSRYFGRLQSTVARRVWAERAAFPVCSKYVQAMLELLVAVREGVDSAIELPDEFRRYWGVQEVEASAPRALPSEADTSDWQSEEGWIGQEEVWTGSLVCEKVSWQKPSRSSVRPLTDGEGPPMLREGCLVIRGPDWDKGGERNDDGHDEYQEAKSTRETETKGSKDSEDEGKQNDDDDITKSPEKDTAGEETPAEDVEEKKRKKKIPHPKLPVGTVIGIEPWNGIEALGRRVRWSLTGQEGLYCFGGDGGRHDIVHVETNLRGTKVTKKYPFPETAEQCASKRGFGEQKSYGVLLRFKKPLSDTKGKTYGILELPDFGAAVKAVVTFESNESVVVREEDLLFGSRDSGWEARFGQPSFVPGSEYKLKLKNREISNDAMSPYGSFSEILSGSTSYSPMMLRDPADGKAVFVTSHLVFLRGRRTANERIAPSVASPPPLLFDKDSHAQNLSVSKDGRSVTCTAADGRGTAFAEVGFSKGCHYWEVKIESCESGSIFIGCAEKPPPEGSNRFNRWLGWGFVNFRATYTGGSERVYGVHAHAGDTIGVVLDCDAGRISFFYDGMKYGEHILNDLGCAFENISPFGFSVEGCGTGGQGQGATSGFPRSPAQGFVRPKTLFPVVGLRNHGDRVTMCPSWSTTYGTDGRQTLNNILRVVDSFDSYNSEEGKFPSQVIEEAYSDYKKWLSSSTVQTKTRGCRAFQIELDTSAYGCAAACAALGLQTVLLAGDRVRLKRSSGRKLELAEEAVVLGQHQLRLYYKLVLQKNEGQSLNEGGNMPHFFEECDLAGGIDFVRQGGHDRPQIPLLDRFKWRLPCGLKVVYSGGAVIRSDIEINDSSRSLGTVPVDYVIPKEDILERRVNSCGVVRFLIRYEGLEGYVSANIRGGSEEAIVEPEKSLEPSDLAGASFNSPFDVASQWVEGAKDVLPPQDSTELGCFGISSLEEYNNLLALSVPQGMNAGLLDETLVEVVSALGDSSSSADALGCSFGIVASVLSKKFMPPNDAELVSFEATSGALAAAVPLGKVDSWEPTLPSLHSVMVRLSVLRTVNLRSRFALPWMPIRPAQQGSAILGGAHGWGPSCDKAGVTSLAEKESWWTAPSIAVSTRNRRGLLFTSVKRDLLASIADVTSTPTPLSHDEYELPREIRTVRINRMRAARAMESSDPSIKRKYSVFSQLQNETKSWGGAALRRSYVAKGHGGQKRAFKVKFVGEGVNDYSGPYREVFAEAMNEVLKTNKEGNGVLGVLDLSPNAAAGIGENQGQYVFSSNGQNLGEIRPELPLEGVDEKELFIRNLFSSLLSSRNEASREVEEALIFLGRLAGTAYRHGILLDLPLPQSAFWRFLAEEAQQSPSTQTFEIDVLASRGDPSNPLLWWQKRMLNFFLDGLSNVIPTEVLPLFSAQELQDAFCGSSDVDVDMLKKVVEYEGYRGDEAVIQNFWTVLRESTSEDRKAFLQYVWARNRLPSRVSDFETPFKILRDTANAERADHALPSASTCFFSLTLPEYTDAEILRRKLLFAVHNVTTMETDFQTNSAEVAEGYRALT